MRCEVFIRICACNVYWGVCVLLVLQRSDGACEAGSVSDAVGDVAVDLGVEAAESPIAVVGNDAHVNLFGRECRLIFAVLLYFGVCSNEACLARNLRRASRLSADACNIAFCGYSSQSCELFGRFCTVCGNCVD